MSTRWHTCIAIIIAAGLVACSEPSAPPVVDAELTMLSSSLTVDCAGQSSMPATECEALVALYNSTNGDEWTNNGGWRTQADPCNWFGVDCLVTSDGRWYLEVDLRYNNLAGPIPPEVGDLTTVDILWLADNPHLSGLLPPEVGDLTDLAWIDLYFTGVSGQVPLAVAQLGGIIGPYYCRFTRTGLFMPDTQPYRDADLDADGSICGIALGADTDGDAIPDATDPDLLAEFLETIPDAAFKSGDGGHRNAMQSNLDDIQQSIADGDVDQAIRMLQNLRRHVDGCGTAADNTDWIIDCSAQVSVRSWIDTLITNLGG